MSPFYPFREGGCRKGTISPFFTVFFYCGASLNPCFENHNCEHVHLFPCFAWKGTPWLPTARKDWPQNVIFGALCIDWFDWRVAPCWLLLDEVGGVDRGEDGHLRAELQHLIPRQRRVCSSLPGNLIQETLALPIGKLTGSHWPKNEEEMTANFFSTANKPTEKSALCC